MRKLASGIQGFKLKEVYAQGGSEKGEMLETLGRMISFQL